MQAWWGGTFAVVNCHKVWGSVPVDAAWTRAWEAQSFAASLERRLRDDFSCCPDAGNGLVNDNNTVRFLKDAV